jgi:hypothetical protein
MQEDTRDRFRTSRSRDVAGRPPASRASTPKPLNSSVTQKQRTKNFYVAVKKQMHVSVGGLKNFYNLSRINKRTKLGISILVATVVIVALATQRNDTAPTAEQQQTSRGSNSTTSDAQAPPPDALPNVENPEFSIFKPPNNESTEVKQISPPGNDPVYVFIDEVGGASVRVSQQQLPEAFKTEQASKLKELADSFQAGSIIQIDGNKIYHGYSDKNGGVQSLVFIWSDRLFLVSADQKLSDETWVGYITSLE